MTQVLMIALAALALLALLMSLLLLGVIRRLRFVATRGHAIEPQEIAPPVRALLAPGEQQLAQLGFVEGGAMLLESMTVQGKPQPQATLVYVHGDAPAAAQLVQLLTPDQARHYTIHFVSRRADGTFLVTRNRQSVSGPSPHAQVIVHDCWLPTWREVWQAHVAHMNAMAPDAAQWQRPSVAEWVAASLAEERTAFDLRVARGDLVDAGDGTWRIGTRRALVMVGRAWATWRASRQPMRDDVAVTGAPDAAPAPHAAVGIEATPPTVQAKVEAYERDAAQRRGSPWSRRAKWLVFAVTAALAAASFGLSFDVGTLAALLIVLLVHEMGHFAAMRWAGYQDLKVFFLPFLGAAVSGRHERPTARQELIVLYAGPVPGLVLGLAGLVWLEPGLDPVGALASWWHELAVLALVINGFNLLPIHPLDGGKIFEILLLGRWPWLAFAGRMLGIALLAWFALAMNDGTARTVMLAFVAVMLLGAGVHWREARVATSLRPLVSAGGLDRASALHAVFGALDKLGYGAQPWPNQRVVADALLPALARPAMRPMARALGLAGYVAMLLLPVVVLVAQVWSSIAPATVLRGDSGDPARMQAAADAQARAMRELLEQRRAELAALRARVNAEADPAQRWALLEAEIDQVIGELPLHEPQHLRPAVELLQAAAAIAPALPDATAKIATAALWQHAAARDPAAQATHLEAALRAYDAPDGASADPDPLVRATLAWLDATPFDRLQARLDRIERCLTFARTRSRAYELTLVQTYKADHLLAAGRTPEALAYARSVFDAALDSGDAARVTPAATLLADATWAAEGASAALDRIDAMLPRIDARMAAQPHVAAALRLQGMWIAEAAERAEWQREQVTRIDTGASALAAAGALVWSVRVGYGLSGWLSAGKVGGAPLDPRDTIVGLELAHWRGDAAEARRIAASIRRRLSALRLSPGARIGQQQVIAPRKLEALAAVRRAVYERYGLAVATE